MRVIVTETVAEAVSQRVSALESPVELVVVDRDGWPVTHGDHESSEASLAEAEALLRENLSAEGFRRVLESAPRLRWLHSSSAGVERLLDSELRRRGLIFTSSAGVYAIPIAEWVLHMLLMIVKRGAEMIDRQRDRQWHDAPGFEELTGKTVTILGAGGIGIEVAKRAAAFDMRVWGINRSGRDIPHVERVISGDGWRDALPETDFLVITAPLTPATRGMIGARELDLLPSHAWLINVARGAIVDEPALVESLQAGRIGGAALDVFVEEPLPAGSPLWTLPNVLIAPHHSGSSPRSGDRMLDRFIDNLRRFTAGDDLRNIVDLDAGY
jgi:phosphoglycerate dehydrogenase-like enzyme